MDCDADRLDSIRRRTGLASDEFDIACKSLADLRHIVWREVDAIYHEIQLEIPRVLAELPQKLFSAEWLPTGLLQENAHGSPFKPDEKEKYAEDDGTGRRERPDQCAPLSPGHLL